MITLHGFASSNYYNIVKHVLLQKGIPFEEDLTYGGTDDYLAISPAGKIPSITTADGQHLSESSVCCDYLEDAYPDHPLYPADPYARAHVRQIMKVSELYLELAARRLLIHVFGNTDAPAELQADVKATMERGVGAMTRICRFGPYIAGSELSMADIYVRYVLKVAAMAAQAKLGWDPVQAIPGLAQWGQMMDADSISQQVDADSAANQPEFMAYIRSRFEG